MHLLAAADAELALHMPVFIYFGKRKEELVDLVACSTAHKMTPDMGTILSLALFFSRLCALGVIIMCGTE
tara:strand:- start:267 stop:476 length:210 start_codon:yes stop_codon:yes gene_type:complete